MVTRPPSPPSHPPPSTAPVRRFSVAAIQDALLSVCVCRCATVLLHSSSPHFLSITTVAIVQSLPSPSLPKSNPVSPFCGPFATLRFPVGRR